MVRESWEGNIKSEKYRRICCIRENLRFLGNYYATPFRFPHFNTKFAWKVQVFCLGLWVIFVCLESRNLVILDDVADCSNDLSEFLTDVSYGGRREKTFFWQYNTQSKGPKGKRLCRVVNDDDPYVLHDFEDPVFDSDVMVDCLSSQNRTHFVTYLLSGYLLCHTHFCNSEDH